MLLLLLFSLKDMQNAEILLDIDKLVSENIFKIYLYSS